MKSVLLTAGIVVLALVALRKNAVPEAQGGMREGLAPDARNESLVVEATIGSYTALWRLTRLRGTARSFDNLLGEGRSARRGDSIERRYAEARAALAEADGAHSNAGDAVDDFLRRTGSCRTPRGCTMNLRASAAWCGSRPT